MKKSFYFALALTAGLFASCSSDELTSQAPQGGIEINDNEAAQIKIGVDNATVKVTRGTGTVGAVGSTDNAWAGQKFNLFMFEKGKLIAAQKTVKVGGVDTQVDIYNNAELTAPTTAAGTNSGTATYVIGEEEQFDYYPTTGAYSFWAYRADDAADTEDADANPTTPETPIVNYTDDAGTAATAATGTQVRIPFTIDGSQDIMLATPDVDASKTALINYSTTDAISTDAQAEEKIYTAFSARRGVYPTLKFTHALARLTFQVKAAEQSVSDAADVVGTADYRGFKVTEISVKCHQTGEIIAADLTNGNQSVVFNTTAATVGMPLKSRPRKIDTKEVGDFSNKLTIVVNPADGTPTYAGTFVHTDATKNYAVNNGNVEVYTSNEVDEYSGKPIQESQKLSSLVAAAWAADNTIDHVDVYHWNVTTPGAETFPAADAPASAKLIALRPVVPTWDITGATTEYEWVAANEELYDEAVTAGDNLDQIDNASANAAEAKTLYTGTTNPAAVGNLNKVVKITGTKLAAPVYLRCVEKYTGATAATNAQETPIGEALLLEPGVGSYEMTIKYKRWKKTSTNNYAEQEGTLTKAINHPGGTFLPSNSYKVLITLYSDGSATTNTELDPWTDSGVTIPVEGEE